MRDVVESSQQRINEIVKNELAIAKLAKNEKLYRAKFSKDLKKDIWISSFRGRDILKRFVDGYVKVVKYEVFRDLILARMRDDGFQPPGMKNVIDKILDE